MRRPTVPPELCRGPFTVEQAVQHGVTRQMLRSDAWRRMMRGVYVHAGIPDSRELRARALGLLIDGLVFACGVTAAWLYGVDLHPLGEPLPSLWVGCHTGHKPRPRPGWTLREITVSEADLCVVRGVRATSPLRTAFDCARWLRFTDAVVVLDKLAHDGLLRLDDLVTYAEQQPPVRHKRRIPSLVEWADPLSQSPPESRLRVWLREAGFSVSPQHPVRDDNGRVVAYIDLALVEERIAIEYQGAHHAAIGADDERRRQMLRDLGWEVIYVYAADVAGESARQRLFFRIRALAARRG